MLYAADIADGVSTHSRPKAAGFKNGVFKRFGSFNTQPPEGGWNKSYLFHKVIYKFQHTAARRRLGPGGNASNPTGGFNTQPPEGGWDTI